MNILRLTNVQRNPRNLRPSKITAYTVYLGEFIYKSLVFYRVCAINMHCISSLKLVGSMAVGLGLSGVGLVDKSVEINLGEWLVIYRVWPVNVHCRLDNW